MSAVDDFLAGYSPAVRDLAMQARTVVLSVMPDAVEAVHSGWKTISYGTAAGMNAQVCYIAPLQASVTLGFHRGTALPDPHGLLKGTGKNMRHVKLHRPEDLGTPGLRDLLEAAVRLDAE